MKPIYTLYLILLAIILTAAACSPAEPGEDPSPLLPETETAGADGAEGQTALPPTAVEVSPTQSPEAAGEAGPDILVPETGGACSNPYYPIRGDTTWTYWIHNVGTEEESFFSVSFSEITPDSFQSNLTLTDRDTGELLSGSAAWYCEEEGLISSDFASIFFTQLENIEFDTLDYEGVFLLPAEQWDIGAAWETVYQINADFSLEELSFNSDMEIQLTNTIKAVEEVSVPAGTFPEAYRVDSEGTLTIDLDGGESGSALLFSDLPLEFSSWYVRGTGLVKQRTTGEDAMGQTIELYSLE